jgi:hypothetical protein
LTKPRLYLPHQQLQQQSAGTRGENGEDEEWSDDDAANAAGVTFNETMVASISSCSSAFSEF